MGIENLKTVLVSVMKMEFFDTWLSSTNAVQIIMQLMVSRVTEGCGMCIILIFGMLILLLCEENILVMFLCYELECIPSVECCREIGVDHF